MEAFDPSKLRDPDFRARYEAKLAEIEAVRTRHTFLDYSTRNVLFDELEAIYRENLVEYDTHYRQNQLRWEELENRLQSEATELYPYHRVQARQMMAEAQACLEAPAYAENAKARAVLDRLETFLSAARREYAACEEALGRWAQRLGSIAPEVWAEEAVQLEQALAEARQRLTDPQQAPPAHAPTPDEEALAAAINRKATDLKRLGRPRGRWRARIAALEQAGVPRAQFLALQAEKRRQSRRRWWLAGSLGTVLLLLGAAAAWWGPDYLDRRAELEAWAAAEAEGTVSAYQNYLDMYPTGPHAEMALAAQMRIPSGSLQAYADPMGRVLDYEGELQNLQPHGEGKGIYRDGSRYEGHWRAGLPDSTGTYTAADGTRYIGEWHIGRREGQGTRYFAEGGQYEGGWLEDRYHGFGSLILPDSSYYIGAWQQGKRHGQGRSRSAAGATYQGGWQDDRFHGRGIYRDSTGRIYDGQWVAGQRQGQGVETWPDGRTFAGQWEGGLRQGKGTLAWPDGSKLEAPWARDTVNGWGQFTTRYRDAYTGTWRGTLDRITLYDGQGNVFKTGRIENGLFLDLE